MGVWISLVARFGCDRPSCVLNDETTAGRDFDFRARIEHGGVIAAARDENYPATISLVISNRPEAPGLERAAAEGVATAVLDHRAFADRASFNSGLRSLIEASGAELVACAGYMRIMTPEFVNSYAGRMINIHPALLPLYRGLDTHARALADGVRIHGCTVHFVTPEIDSGPIIAQAPCRLSRETRR